MDPCDTEGLERPCRTLVHPPIAVERLEYDGTRATTRGRRVHPVSGEDAVTLDPLEMLARLCQHIPPPGLHLTRLYGATANRTRGGPFTVAHRPFPSMITAMWRGSRV